MLGNKPNDPIKSRKKTKVNEKPVDKELYHRLVGKRTILEVNWEIDLPIPHKTQHCIYSQYGWPTYAFINKNHLKAVHKILRYLKKSPTYAFINKKSLKRMKA